jgi:cytochrome c
MVRAAGASLIVLLCQCFVAGPSAQTSSQEAVGKALVQKHCATCHAIGLSDRSKHPAAPAFRQILKRYPASVLTEALAEGLSTGHPDMPEFTFGPRETAAIVRYLESISE